MVEDAYVTSRGCKSGFDATPKKSSFGSPSALLVCLPFILHLSASQVDTSRATADFAEVTTDEAGLGRSGVHYFQRSQEGEEARRGFETCRASRWRQAVSTSHSLFTRPNLQSRCR